MYTYWKQTPDCVGLFHGGAGTGAVELATVDEAKALTELGQVDLTVLHYQDPGYQHYCLRLDATVPVLRTATRERLLAEFNESPLVRVMRAGNTLGAVRLALSKLGIEIPSESENDEPADVSSSAGESSESEEGSDEP
jgi:hypothetical protein